MGHYNLKVLYEVSVVKKDPLIADVVIYLIRRQTTCDITLD